MRATPFDVVWAELAAEEFPLLAQALRFFFSSRRRHTRFDCDWSSDVCSSDLTTIIGFGKAAVSRLAPLVSDDRWYAQLAGATILGAIASPEAVPLLQPLLRKSDARVAQAAVAALGKKIGRAHV